MTNDTNNIFLTLSKEQLADELKNLTKYALVNDTGFNLLEAVARQLNPPKIPDQTPGSFTKPNATVDEVFPHSHGIKIVYVSRSTTEQSIDVYFMDDRAPDRVMIQKFNNDFRVTTQVITGKLNTTKEGVGISIPNISITEAFEFIVKDVRTKLFGA